jgi:hypothetical protein
MAWTAPRTWVTGELVTAALMNTHVKDNLTYLQSWAQSDVTGSRAIDATVYQNTKDFILIVQINVQCDIDDLSDAGNSLVTVHCGSATPPTDQVGIIGITHNSGTTGTFYAGLSITFVVLPDYYYKATASNVVGGGAPTLLDWFEWGPT